MAEHTSGPWEMLESWPGAIRVRAFVVAPVNASGLAIADVTSSVADARLMAAAPELLETLKTCVAHIRAMTHDFDDPEDEAPELVAADALIAKAEGRQP